MILPHQSPPVDRTKLNGEYTLRDSTITTSDGRVMTLCEVACRGESTIQPSRRM